jgi:hypothetical protein
MVELYLHSPTYLHDTVLNYAQGQLYLSTSLCNTIAVITKKQGQLAQTTPLTSSCLYMGGHQFESPAVTN